MSSVKVLHVVNSLNVGGLEKIVIDLVGSFSDKYNSVILCLENEGILGKEIEGIQILTLNRKPGLSLGVTLGILRILKQYKIDIVHTHNAAPHFYGALAGSFLGIPVVHTKHGRNDPGAKKKLFLNWFSSLLTKKIITVSDDAKDVCLVNEQVNSSKIVTIWNGIDVNRFKKQPDRGMIRCEFGVSSDDFLLGIVARLCPEKNHEMLLHACRLVADKKIPFKLLVVGDGPLRDEVGQLVVTLGLESVVIFTGLRSDIPEILNELDVFCLSSVTEGVPLTLLEALACSLPCVVTDVGGNAEVIQDGLCGFIVPSNDPIAFADKIIELYKKPGLRENFSKLAHVRVERFFSIQETAQKYEDVYGEILGNELK